MSKNASLAAVTAKIIGSLFLIVIAMYVTNWILSANDWSDGQYSEYAVNNYRYPAGAGPELLLKHQVERNYLTGFAAALYMGLMVYLSWRFTSNLERNTRKWISMLTIVIFLIILVVHFGPVVYKHEPITMLLNN